ncbi:hypothetical protein GCM10023075_40380 [Streptosporangium album]
MPWSTTTADEEIHSLKIYGCSTRLDPADVSVVAIAERLGVTQIATIDRRDFTLIRPRHVSAFRLLPDVLV